MANGEAFEMEPMESIFKPSGRGKEKVEQIKLSQLHPFKNHPYKVVDDAKMDELVESIKQSGVLVPGIVRKREDSEYEIIAGHRRKRACELAGLKSMPVFIRELSDDEADVAVVDSNEQRDGLLPSERAFSLKMWQDAMNRKAGRPSDNSDQIDPNLKGIKSTDILGKRFNLSGPKVFRFIRLTELIPALLDKVDNKTLGFIPAVELSYLKTDEQKMVSKVDKKLSLIQASSIRKHSQEGTLSEDILLNIINNKEIKKENSLVNISEIKRFISKPCTPEQISEIMDQVNEIVADFLKDWSNNNIGE